MLKAKDLLRKMVNADVVIQVGVLEDGSHVPGGQFFNLESVRISKNETWQHLQYQLVP